MTWRSKIEEQMIREAREHNKRVAEEKARAKQAEEQVDPYAGFAVLEMESPIEARPCPRKGGSPCTRNCGTICLDAWPNANSGDPYTWGGP